MKRPLAYAAAGFYSGRDRILGLGATPGAALEDARRWLDEIRVSTDPSPPELRALLLRSDEARALLEADDREEEGAA